MTASLAIATAAAPNYLAQARTLAASLHRFHPDVPFFALIPGAEQSTAFAGLPARLLPVADLRLGGEWLMRLRYDPKQFVVAAKPALLRYMLESGYRCAIFLDPDILVTAPLDPVFETVARHSLTLTPHLPLEYLRRPDASLERELLLAGMFNGGFIGVTGTEEACRFLAWWEKRLRTHCLDRVRQGIHYDQRWLDLAPAFVADLYLLRDPGCNAAYWNLPWLELHERDGQFFVGESPLRFFHFSGFSPHSPEQVSKYRPGWRNEEPKAVAELFRLYHRLLLEAGWDECARLPWPWRIRHAIWTTAGCLLDIARRLLSALRGVDQIDSLHRP